MTPAAMEYEYIRDEQVFPAARGELKPLHIP
jgi:hypothetical protein